MLSYTPIYLWFVLFLCTLIDVLCSSDRKCNVHLEWHCGSAPSQPSYACCNSLNDALNYTAQESGLCNQQFYITMHFNSITEALYSNSSSTFHENIAQISLLGAPGNTVIQCEVGAGLIFNGTTHMNKSMDTCIRHMSFHGCGAPVKNTLAALYFVRHCHVELSHVTLFNSNGSGLALINVSGGVNVSRSLFFNNIFLQGAGVYINISLNESVYTHIDKRQLPYFKFAHCNFSGNQALPPRTPYDNTDTRGGGMLVHFTGSTRNAFLTLHMCSFTNNSATWGSGMLMNLDRKARNNVIIIRSTTFLNNHYRSRDLYLAGGGAMIIISGNSSANNISLNSCTFQSNSASWGGGLEVYSVPSKERCQKCLNHISISKSIFKNNTATNGAALNIYCTSVSTIPEMCNTVPSIQDSKFTHNGQNIPLPSYAQMTEFAASVASINNFPTMFEGVLHFINNSGSPLHITETSVTLKENTTLVFSDNVAHNGGAISLYGAWITVSDNSKLFFTRNKAVHKGGAIFVYQTKEEFLPHSHNCFIQYMQYIAPWSWESLISFAENTAGSANNSIFATSILPCVWHNNSTRDDDIRATFCTWKNWIFHGNCLEEVQTSARNFSATPKHVTMFPGLPRNFVQAVDDLGHIIPNPVITPIITPTILHMTSNYKVQYINNSLIVFGQKNTLVNVFLEVEGDRNIFTMVNVSLQDCPPGFFFDCKSMSCTCWGHIRGLLHCAYGPDLEWTAYLIIGYCMSYSQLEHGSEHIVYGRCPFTPGLESHSQSVFPFLPLPKQKDKLESQFCGKMNRRGILCGRCADNFSIDVFSDSFICQNCSAQAMNWVIFVAFEGLLPLVFFIIVILLHISLTSGPVNGYIFFSQVLTVSMEVIIIRSSWKQTNIHHPIIMTYMMEDLYSVWSLDFSRFFRSFAHSYHLCLGPQLKVIHVLCLRYLSALYPLCLIVVTYVLIELHARNCRILVWLWKPLCLFCVRFRQSWRAKTSVVDAFAAFILLSYVKIVRISLVLTTFTYIYNTNSTAVKKVVNYDPTVTYLSLEHAPFAVIGILLLGTFGLVPPLLLSCYQFRHVQRCLNCCKLNRHGLRIFMDAFQGCYKDGKDGGPDRRFFAGLYFIFRLIIFIIFDMTSRVTLTYMALLVACIVFATITVFFQPYKRKIYTYLDVFFFNLLAVIMGLQILGFYEVQTTLHFPMRLMITMYCLTLIPLVYMVCYILLWFWRYICNFPCCGKLKMKGQHVYQWIASSPLMKYFSQQYAYRNENANTSSKVTADDIPDRLANSYRYRTLSLRRVIERDEGQSD